MPDPTLTLADIQTCGSCDYFAGHKIDPADGKADCLAARSTRERTRRDWPSCPAYEPETLLTPRSTR